MVPSIGYQVSGAGAVSLVLGGMCGCLGGVARCPPGGGSGVDDCSGAQGVSTGMSAGLLGLCVGIGKVLRSGPIVVLGLTKVRVLPPVPGLDAFAEYFQGLFGLGESSLEPAALAALLDTAEVPAFLA